MMILIVFERDFYASSFRQKKELNLAGTLWATRYIITEINIQELKHSASIVFGGILTLQINILQQISFYISQKHKHILCHRHVYFVTILSSRPVVQTRPTNRPYNRQRISYRLPAYMRLYLLRFLQLFFVSQRECQYRTWKSAMTTSFNTLTSLPFIITFPQYSLRPS